MALLGLCLGSTPLDLVGQTRPEPAPKVEPGLEEAVMWKWRVTTSEEKDWGLAPPEVITPALPANPSQPGAPAATANEPRPTQYEVQKGDALILIGRKFGMTAQQLKTFNGLETDTIRIGQIIKIPTVEELKALAPPPPPAAAKPQENTPKAETPSKAPAPVETQGQEDLLFQVFLDREQFPTGPIDGTAGPMLAAMLQLYRDSHPDLQNIDQFRQKARDTVGSSLTHYTLKPDDFRFIDSSEGSRRPGGRKGKKGAGEVPAPTYEEMVAAPSLVYRSAWEFVAERFHCEETFLRKLNPRIKAAPSAGAVFQVPNVIPFEIEHAFEGTLQPAADPQQAVTAAVVGLSRLEITRDGKLIAAMPLGLARPDLRGRGSWTILDAIPRPRLATLREMKDASPPPAAPGALGAVPATVGKAVLTSEEFLAPGPNNPVGIVWINLAKAKSTEPLAYGLHGTSIPQRIKSQEGIGGIRLANWDIARAVRLLPAGTALQWK